MNDEYSTELETQQAGRIESLRQEIHRMQDLIHKMGAFIDGQIFRTSFDVKGGRLTIYTYCSADEAGSLAHAKEVANHLRLAGLDVGPVRDTTSGGILEDSSGH